MNKSKILVKHETTTLEKIISIRNSEKESDIQKAILQYLELKKIFAWSNKTQGTFDSKGNFFRKSNMLKGVSDILGILPNGKFLAIEVKKKGNYPSLEQKEFLAKIIDNNGIGFIAYNIDDVVKNLKMWSIT